MDQTANPGIQREWLDLRALTKYAAVSERTLGSWIHDMVNPLPAVKIGNKILVRRLTFDAWLETHKFNVENVGHLVDNIVDEVLGNR